MQSANRRSGGYVATHSTVRNGRIFNVKLSDIRQTYPTVETWNSVNIPQVRTCQLLMDIDENKTTG
jgi:hypothetical protein